MPIITRISNEKTNELIIYGILCRNATVFYRQELASLFQVQKKLTGCRSSNLNLSRCFIADDIHVKIVSLHLVVFSEHDISIFEIMSVCLNINQLKYFKIALTLSITQIKPV